MTELETAIANQKIAPVYVLGGDEPLLSQRVVQALTQAVVAPATRAFNLDVLEAKGAGAAGILGAARTLPMMASRRLVIVRDADALGAALAELVPYLEAPSPETVLVLHVTKIDGRLKFFALAKKLGFLHELTAPREIRAWIRDEAQRSGARLSEDGVRRLADVAAGDLGRLASAIEQLALYVGEGRTIGAADVDELIAETRERTVFELANAVGFGERERALHAVEKLFEQRESAVGVAIMLARHFRQVALCREAAQAGKTRDIPRLVGVPPFAVDGLLQQARRLGPAALVRAVRLLSQCDRDLKGPVKGALGERMVVERVVGSLLDLGSVSGSR